ncbi:hypothetical protein VB690_05875, partial [Nodularia spumigena CH309]|nr:hypothetical protein [Nodularia spumigena CH309]
MKTAEKLAAGWLLTLGFMFLTLSVSATTEKKSMLKPISTGYHEAVAEEFINRHLRKRIKLWYKSIKCY